MKPVIHILSTDSPAAPQFGDAIAQGRLVPIRQDRLTNDDIEAAAGLVTCVGVDQIDLMERRAAIETMLGRGGRMVINGHVLRPYVAGLAPFVPLQQKHRQDYVLTRLNDHPVFEGISGPRLETNRGVAGFYARGHNPMPPGALALTGLGRDKVPADWVWLRPQGGAIFMHAGNDLWGLGDDAQLKREIAERLLRWCLDGQKVEVAA
jgi:hypothetical protein